MNNPVSPLFPWDLVPNSSLHDYNLSIQLVNTSPPFPFVFKDTHLLPYAFGYF